MTETEIDPGELARRRWWMLAMFPFRVGLMGFALSKSWQWIAVEPFGVPALSPLHAVAFMVLFNATRARPDDWGKPLPPPDAILAAAIGIPAILLGSIWVLKEFM